MARPMASTEAPLSRTRDEDAVWSRRAREQLKGAREEHAFVEPHLEAVYLAGVLTDAESAREAIGE
jgi:hypothetical protein